MFRLCSISVLLIGLTSVLSCSEEDPRIPRNGGGGGGGGGGGTGGGASDAASGIDAGDVGLKLSGTLCLVTDMRDPFLCLPTATLEDLQIRIAGTTISTGSRADGSFSLTVPEAGVYGIEIAYGSGDGYRDVFMPITVPDNGISDAKLVAMTNTFWLDLVATIGVLEPSDATGIAVYFLGAKAPKAPIAGVEVASLASPIATVYDGPNGINDWRSGALTGVDGAALMLGLPAIDPTTSFIISGSVEVQTIENVPTFPDVLTIIRVVIQPASEN